MAIKKELKSVIIKKYASSTNDTGSCEVQVGLLSERIKQVSGHLKLFPKDKHSRTGLLKMVGKRKSLLVYLKRNDLVSHNNLVAAIKNPVELI